MKRLILINKKEFRYHPADMQRIYDRVQKEWEEGKVVSVPFGFNVEILEDDERLEEKEVILSADGYAGEDLAYDMGYCPTCNKEYEYGINDWGSEYCSACGQKLKWPESEDNE